VTVGTDHHRFDRLIDWLEDLVPGVLSGDDILVQHGAARASSILGNRDYIPRGELLELMRAADVVVGHGGPGTIMDARSVGRLPVVVPRLAHLDEAVDDHQVAFTRRLAAQGLVVVAEHRDAFRSAVETCLSDPVRVSFDDIEAADVDFEAVEHFRRITSEQARPDRLVVLRRLRSLLRRRTA
jgi:UDP-N-acetylglucosamine transferase subunit ALG13